MPEYYFDIETAPLERYRGVQGAGLEPCESKIISIQYQQLDSSTGQPVGDLQILKEWLPGLSEESIVQQFKKIYIDGGIWQFIPVGNNLAFECKFMKHKLKQYCGLEGLKLGQRPMIDLKHVLVIANNGCFKGYHRLLGKCGLAENMETWYYSKNWPVIEHYIRQETIDFLRAYGELKIRLPCVFD